MPGLRALSVAFNRATGEQLKRLQGDWKASTPTAPPMWKLIGTRFASQYSQNGAQ